MATEVIAEKKIEESYSDRKQNAIECIMNKEKNKLKKAVRKLVECNDETRLLRKEHEQIIDAFRLWMNEERTDGSIVTIAKAFYSWIEKIEIDSKALKAKLSITVIDLLECPDMLMDLEKQKVMKRLMLLAVSKSTTICFGAF